MNTLQVLINRISSGVPIYVQNEDGYYEQTGFDLNPPISTNSIIQFENTHKVSLPQSYRDFLRISNGTILFKDIKYGQWGCKLLSLDEVIDKTNSIREMGYCLDQSYIVFAEWLGDSDVLLFDMDKYRSNKKEYIIDGELSYKVDKWKYIKGDFEKWMDRLIVSQGSKYWRW